MVLSQLLPNIQAHAYIYLLCTCADIKVIISSHKRQKTMINNLHTSTYVCRCMYSYLCGNDFQQFACVDFTLPCVIR